MSASDLSAALSDVRRAYRLLWGFQKRILQYNAFIRERLGYARYTVDYQFGRLDKGIEGKWSWDLLPGALIGFEAVRLTALVDSYPQGEWWNYPKAGDRLLYVNVVADTALLEARERCSHEPNPLSFAAPESTRSELQLWVLENRADRTDRTNWQDSLVRRVATWPGHMEVVMDEATALGLYCEIFDLIKIGDEDDLAVRIDEFAAAADNALAPKRAHVT